MRNQATTKLLGWLISVSLVTVTLIVTPFSTIDPINVPKLAALALFAFMGIAVLFVNLRDVISSQYRPVLFLSGLFLIDLFAVLFFSGANISQQLYGTSGRNTGFITYAALLFLLVTSIYASNKSFIKVFSLVSLSIGIFSAIYGGIQFLDKDPIPWVYVYQSKVLGLLGNPNFQSALLGISATIALSLIFTAALKVYWRLGLVLYICFALLVIKETSARQGILNFIAGAGTVILLLLFLKGFKKLTLILSACGAFGFFFTVLALFNQGPLASLIFKSSLIDRAWYWRAAWNMTTTHPFFGVGHDKFGDWYRRMRTPEVSVSNPSITADTAHNIWFDISSSGGFPLILFYLAILVYVIISIIRVVGRSKKIDIYFVATVGAWVSYQAQSVVSINQIGLAIWGWVFSGVIIGYELNTRERVLVQETNPVEKGRVSNRMRNKKPKISLATKLAIPIGAALGLFIGSPPYLAYAEYYRAIQFANSTLVMNAALRRPLDEARIIQGAKIMQSNNQEAKGLRIIREAVGHFPDSFQAWQVISGFPSATTAEKNMAKTQMKRLDPYNPDL